MGKTIINVGRPDKLSFWEKLYLPEIIRGLMVTMRHTLTFPKVTVEYPDERMEVHPNFRARHRLKTREDGSLRCVACYLCATVCPVQCITIEARESADPEIEKEPARYEIDLARCIFCGLCQEACPKDALELTPAYELAEYRHSQLLYDAKRLKTEPEVLPTKKELVGR